MAEKILKADFEETYRNNCDTVYKIAFIHIKKPDDSNDIVQEVFLKYHLTKKSFADEKEKEAWLIRSAHTATMDYFRTKCARKYALKIWRKCIFRLKSTTLSPYFSPCPINSVRLCSFIIPRDIQRRKLPKFFTSQYPALSPISSTANSISIKSLEVKSVEKR